MASSKNFGNNRPMSGLREMLISGTKPNLHKWEKDGEDHINLGMSRTHLGSLLGLGGISTFHHSELGRFKTLLGFWNYIAHEEHDDRYRILTDKEIRLFNLQRGVTRTPRRVKNFNAIILDAQWQRIVGSEKIKKMLIESTLPFDCYRVNRSGMRERTSYEYWFVPALEEMRKCLKEGRSFDVKPYMQFPNENLYDSIRITPSKPASESPVIIEEMLDKKGEGVIQFTYHDEAIDIITLINNKVSELKPTSEAVINYRVDGIYPTKLVVGETTIELNEKLDLAVVMFQPEDKSTIQSPLGELSLYSTAIGGFVIDGVPSETSVDVECKVAFTYCIK